MGKLIKIFLRQKFDSCGPDSTSKSSVMGETPELRSISPKKKRKSPSAKKMATFYFIS
jgi:hypothetical protein